MKADRKNLAEILTNEIRLVAPLFQRPYVWEQATNWRPMWDAIAECAEARLAERPRAYFMGALVLDQLPYPLGSISPREIIDGQQRMISLQILLAATKRECEKRGWPFLAGVAKRLVENELETPSEETFKVWPTNRDRIPYKGALEGSGSGRLGDASRFFAKELATWLDAAGPFESEQRAKALVESLKGDLAFVVIDLDEKDEGQLIFETMNSLGTPLLPSDLVKNLLFRAAVAQGFDTDALYSRFWSEFEEDAYWQEIIERRGIGRNRLNVFLQTFLTLNGRRMTVLAHQFRDFRELFDEGELGSAEEALGKFSGFAQLYRRFDEAPLGSVAARARTCFGKMGINIFDPVVLGIAAFIEDPSESDRMLATLESYLMRRVLCALSNQSLNKVVFDAVRTLNAEGWSNAHLQSFLLKSSSYSEVWPEDDRVYSYHERQVASGNIASWKLPYVFARIEERKRSNKSESSSLTYDLTIEHIMPRKWAEHWPLPHTTDEDVRRFRVNQLGNLTILTQALNSAVSNAAWSEKRKHLNAHSVLLMNSELAARETWSDDDIARRTRELAEEICRIWPRPSVPSTA